MRYLRVVYQRFRSLFTSRSVDRQLGRELSFHLEKLQEEYMAEGMSAGEARRAARQAMGNLTQQAEQCRDVRRVSFLADLGRDLRFAIVQMRKAPSFAAVLVLCLGLGIGANAAVFSLFHAVLLKMLPVERPEELVVLRNTGGWGTGFTSYALSERLRGRGDLFQGLLARSGARIGRLSEMGMPDTEISRYEYVSGGYFDVLGVRPARGRLFTEEDCITPGAHSVAVISHEFWQRRFGGAEGIAGKQVLLDEQPFTILGVAAPGFRGVNLEEATEIWVPLMMAPSVLSQKYMSKVV